MRLTCAALAAVLTGAGAALADAPPYCPQNGADLDAATLARVKPGRRAHFIHGGEVRGCPSAATACQRAAFIVGGDPLVVTAAAPGLVCAAFVDTRGRSTDGWIEADAVAPEAPPSPLWAADWSRPEQDLDIAPAGTAGHFTVIGSATFHSGQPNVSMGEVAGDVVPHGDRAGFAQGEVGVDAGTLVHGISGDAASLPYDAPGEGRCRVALRALGPYLLARDNERCGGYNVSFTGVYRDVSPVGVKRP